MQTGILHNGAYTPDIRHMNILSLLTLFICVWNSLYNRRGFASWQGQRVSRRISPPHQQQEQRHIHARTETSTWLVNAAQMFTKVQRCSSFSYLGVKRIKHPKLLICVILTTRIASQDVLMLHPRLVWTYQKTFLTLTEIITQ